SGPPATTSAASSAPTPASRSAIRPPRTLRLGGKRFGSDAATEDRSAKASIRELRLQIDPSGGAELTEEAWFLRDEPRDAAQNVGPAVKDGIEAMEIALEDRLAQAVRHEHEVHGIHPLPVLFETAELANGWIRRCARVRREFRHLAEIELDDLEKLRGLLECLHGLRRVADHQVAFGTDAGGAG